MLIKSIISLFKSMGLNVTCKALLRNIASINHYYILQRGLADLIEERVSRVKFYICIANNEDIMTIINNIKYIDNPSRKEIFIRMLFNNSGFKNCYIAKTTSGDIACLQWLIYPNENDIIKKYYSNRFNLLREKQVMVENAFTYPKYRGLGLKRDMTNELLKEAKKRGYTSAITYVRKDLIHSINENIRNGFKITKLVTECKIFGFTKRFL